jgi:hypothetical protein
MRTGRKTCPVCSMHQMEKLNRIEHDDKSVTIYWRRSKCSHVQVTRTPAALTR